MTKDDTLTLCAAALEAAATLAEAGRNAVSGQVMKEGKADSAALEAGQFASHGYAWLATYAAALRQLHGWAVRLDVGGRLGELETLILRAGFGEYLSQMRGGIPLSQGEIARPADIGIAAGDLAAFATPAVEKLIAGGNTNQARMRIAGLIADASFGERGLGDETLEMIDDQFRRFTEEKVKPHAHGWHRKDVLIPIELVEEMAALGVFGLTIPEENGGHGLGKVAMCVVTEALSRGYIGVGSLGTRSEIAGELIRAGGTPEQKARWLPGIASGEVLPTAVFTEPNTGSDLASLSTRAVRDGDTYRITGNKTWITHAARTDLMTLLVRTGKPEDGYRG
ncbi:MAG: acyl-CoA dehydrogenase family protein, partial [Alphaproteobacteria bacterium]